MTWKGILIAAASYAASFILPVKHFLLLVLGLVIADWITGVRASKKEGRVINSAGLRRSTEKVAVYFVTILSSHGIGVVFFPSDLLPLVYLVSGYICLTEFVSIMENAERVTGVKFGKLVREKLLEVLHLTGKKKD